MHIRVPFEVFGSAAQHVIPTHNAQGLRSQRVSNYLQGYKILRICTSTCANERFRLTGEEHSTCARDSGEQPGETTLCQIVKGKESNSQLRDFFLRIPFKLPSPRSEGGSGAKESTRTLLDLLLCLTGPRETGRGVAMVGGGNGGA